MLGLLLSSRLGYVGLQTTLSYTYGLSTTVRINVITSLADVFNEHCIYR